MEFPFPSVWYAARRRALPVTENYPVQFEFSGDLLAAASSQITITLPDAAFSDSSLGDLLVNDEHYIRIFNRGTANVIVAAYDETPLLTLRPGAAANFVCNGSEWIQDVRQASDVRYDPAESGLAAGNAQEAIDELQAIKADKVNEATEDNLAKLDAGGNLADSGKSLSDLQDVSEKGAANGYAGLDEDGVVPTEQLPGSGAYDHGGLSGLSDDDHGQYHNDARGDARYSQLGHGHDGTYEPANADIQTHIGTTSGNPHNVSKGDVGLGHCDNTSDVDKPVSSAQQTAIVMAYNAMLQLVGQLGSLITPLYSGWIPVDDEDTWTYASATTFTVSGDFTGKYQKGDKIKLTQGGSVKYFYVVGVSYSSPNTTVTVTGGSDYSLASAAITGNYYSKSENPQGFPDWFNWTPSFTGFSSNPPGGIYKFKIRGRECVCVIRQPSTGTSNATSFTISAPVTSATIAYMYWGTCGAVTDNGVRLDKPGDIEIGSNSNSIGVNKDASAAGWTASGAKRLVWATLAYEF